MNLNSNARGKRGSRNQKAELINFMEENINFAHERFENDCGAVSQKEKWHELANKLNAVGGAKKTSEQWRQYWRDLKRNVKSKAAEEKRKLEESGINGFNHIKSNMDEFDRRVLSIITPDVIDGDGECQERGLNLPTYSYVDVIESNETYNLIEAQSENVPVLSVSESVLQPSPPAKRPRLSRAPIRETSRKLDAYLEFEKTKLKFEQEKFKCQNDRENEKLLIQKQKLALEGRKVSALETIGQCLKDISNQYNVEYLN